MATKNSDEKGKISLSFNIKDVIQYLFFFVIGGGVYFNGHGIPGIPGIPGGTSNSEELHQATKTELVEKIEAEHKKLHQKIDKVSHKLELLDNSVDTIKDALIKKKLGSNKSKPNPSG